MKRFCVLGNILLHFASLIIMLASSSKPTQSCGSGGLLLSSFEKQQQKQRHRHHHHHHHQSKLKRKCEFQIQRFWGRGGFLAAEGLSKTTTSATSSSTTKTTKTSEKSAIEFAVQALKRGSVIVDVAIDQGGCVETSKPTTHADPTYVVDGIVHYCVANMPGGVPMTSTLALNSATLPFVLKLAQDGYKDALTSDANFLAGLNVCQGNVTYKAVADDLGYNYVDPSKAIN